MLAGPDIFQFEVVFGTQIIAAPASSATSLCAGTSLTVSTTATGEFGVGNLYQVFLSDPQGNFGNATLIGTSTDPAAIFCTLPAYLSSGNGYKLKVVSTSPIVSSAISAQTLEIIGSDLHLQSPADDISSQSGNRSATATIKASNKITGTSNMTYRSGRYQTLEPGFEVQAGTVFKASVESVCPN